MAAWLTEQEFGCLGAAPTGARLLLYRVLEAPGADVHL
jgi:hypothetical protein